VHLAPALRLADDRRCVLERDPLGAPRPGPLLEVERPNGRLRPNDVTVAVLKDFIREKSKTLSSTTVNLLIRLLSSLYTDLVEDGHAEMNPTRLLSKSTRKKFLKPAHDPKLTPHIEAMADAARVYQSLVATSPSVGMAYALGSLGAMRTGEVRALAWRHVDLAAKQIHVPVQVEHRRGRTRRIGRKTEPRSSKTMSRGSCRSRRP
jgi:integrase